MWTLDALDVPSLSADGSAVHAIDAEGVLRAYDARTGALRLSAAPPPGARYTREEALGDDVIALRTRDEGLPREVCRIAAGGRVRWCAALERPLADVVVADGGVAVATGGEDLRALDADTGRALGDWLEGAELHLYRELGAPHDTLFLRAAAVLGRLGGVTVVAGRDGLAAWRADGAVAWRRPLAEPDALAWGGFGAGLAFLHRGGPAVSGAAGLWRVGPELVALSADGSVRWAREAAGRPLVVGGRWFVVEEAAVVSLDPATGAERWRTAVDGVPAVVGEEGPLGEGPATVVWVDGAGAVAARTPVPAAAALAAGGCGLLVDAGPDGWSCVDRAGLTAWSRPGPVEVVGGAGIGVSGPVPFDLATGAPFGPLEGSFLAAAGGTWLLAREGGGYAVRAAPR